MVLGLSRMCNIAFVLGRHINEPFVEGGGKVTYLVAKALSEIGIQTYLVKINYLLPGEGFYIARTNLRSLGGGPLDELELKVGLFSQDYVLNKIFGSIASNLIELVTSPLLLTKLIKRISHRERNICIFIGNSSKLGGVLLSQFFKRSAENMTKILAIYRREEILRHTSRVVRPNVLFTTSRELLIRTSKLIDGLANRIAFSYPPLLPEDICGVSHTRKLPLLLYMGRVTNQRFPLHSLKHIVINLKKTTREVLLVIIFPPESTSIEWLRSAKELISKLDARNRVFLIPKTLDNNEKKSILSKASVFLFPSKGVAAIEPPLTVIESLAHGQYLVTTGDNSTRELVYSSVGQQLKNFEELDVEECLNMSNRLNQKISRWAHEAFAFKRLVHSLKDVVSQN